MKRFLSEFPIFMEHMSTLRDTSRDESKVSSGGEMQYLTDSEVLVVNFDDVKTAYTKNLGLSNSFACSVDALVLLDGRLAFIEFKNGKHFQKELRFKVKDSLLLFCDITKKFLDFTRKNIDLYVVYREKKGELNEEEKEDNARQCWLQDSEARDKIWGNFAILSNEEIIRFGLKRFKWLYFHDVHTYTKKEFESTSVRIISCL